MAVSSQWAGRDGVRKRRAQECPRVELEPPETRPIHGVEAVGSVYPLGKPLRFDSKTKPLPRVNTMAAIFIVTCSVFIVTRSPRQCAECQMPAALPSLRLDRLDVPAKK